MQDQNVFVQISIIYCMVHMLVLFFLFYEYRGSRRKFWTVTGMVIGLISVVCLHLLFTQGIAAMGQYGLIIGTLPMLLLFFVFAKDRNAKFVFIFCLADAVNMWIQLSSGLIDYAVGGGGLVTLALRVIIYPLLEYAVWRWLHQPFFEISTPCLMMEFSNSCDKDTRLGPDGLPVPKSTGHGIGTRSIAAFAEKYQAVCPFQIESGWFKLRLAL